MPCSKVIFAISFINIFAAHSNKTRGSPNIGGGSPNIGTPLFCKTSEFKRKQAPVLHVPTRWKHKIRTKVYFLTLKRPVSATSTDFALTQPIYPPKELLVAGCGLLEMPICLRSAKRVATVESRKLPATNNQKPQLFLYGLRSKIQRGDWGTISG
jgi:hypothetical protein